jgi:WD40 repeat protein
MKKHTASITSISEHTTKPWISTTAKDGLICIWDYETGKLLCDVPPLTDGILDKKVNPLTVKLECRGCW